MALPNTRISPEFKIDEFYVSSLMFSLEQTIMKVKLQIIRQRRNEVTIQTDYLILEIIMMTFISHLPCQALCYGLNMACLI